MKNTIREFTKAIHEAGLVPPSDIITDDRIHRLSTNCKHDDDSGGSVVHFNSVPTKRRPAKMQNYADDACVFRASPVLIGVKEKALPQSSKQSSDFSPRAFVHISEILPEVFKEILEQAEHAKALPNAGGPADRCAA